MINVFNRFITGSLLDNKILKSGMIFIIFAIAFYGFMAFFLSEKKHTTGHYNDAQVQISSMGEIIKEAKKKPHYLHKDFRQRLDIILSNENIDEQKKALSTLYRHWMKTAPQEALAHIQTLNGVLSKQLLEFALLAWANLDFEGQDDWFLAISVDGRFDSLLSQMVVNQNIPEYLAIEWAQRIDDLAHQDEAITAVLTRWATNDPAESIAWSVSSLRNEEFTSILFSYVARGDVGQAVESLSLLTKSQHQTIIQAAEAIKKNLKPEHVTADLMADITRLPAGGIQEQVVQVLFSTFINTMSNDELAQALQALPASEARNALQQQFVYAWAQKEPSLAASYSRDLPSGAERSRALQKVVSSWQKQDLLATSDWLSSVNHDTDQAAQSMVYFAASDPKNLHIARLWAENITDERMKAQSTMVLISSWYETNSIEALAYLNEQTIFTADEKIGYTKALAQR